MENDKVKLSKCECFLVVGVPAKGNKKKINSLEVISLRGEKFEVAGNKFYIHKAVAGYTKDDGEVDYVISDEDYVITEATTGLRAYACHGGELYKEQQLDKFRRIAMSQADNITHSVTTSKVASSVKLMTAAKNGEAVYTKLR
jgi:hypothetical protein